jgi:RNA polymerase sigma factor (sigma-70 family)
MTALPDWHMVSDSELACAAAAGDRGAFGAIYDRYADRLHDFCIGMVRDRDAAADCVQEVFCTVADRLSQLKDADKLRPWLYAIARNEALRHIRQRGRERVFDQVPEAVSAEPGPDTLAARTELADLIAEAAGGLSDRDRAVLELAYRHGLDGPELAEALGVSHASAKKMTQRLRETIERSLGALLVSRRVRTNAFGCAELAAILDGWDGKFSVLMRKRIARHIESCPTCDQERRRLVNPVALLGTAPVFIPAPDWLRDRTLARVRLSAATTATAGTADSPDDDRAAVASLDESSGRRRFPRRSVLLGLLAAAVIASVGVTVGWLYGRDVRTTPADITQTAPAPTSSPVPAAPRTADAPPAVPTQASLVPTAPAVTPPPPLAPPSAPPTAPVAPSPVVTAPRPVTTPPVSTTPATPTSVVVTPKPRPVTPPEEPTTSPAKPPNPVLTQPPQSPVTKKPPTTTVIE